MKQGRVVVITGAAGAVGAVLVERFLANDDAVIATDVNAETLERLYRHPGANPGLITAVADISDEDDCGRLADLVRERAGSRVDVLVNCAGFFPFRPFEEMSSQEWRRVIDVNLTGPFLLTRALLPFMRDHGWGRIINFGSASVFAGAPGQSHYVAAKAGIVGFSRSLARAVGGYGITVNIITPGLTLSKTVRDHFPADLLAAQREARALQRDEEPEDLVGAVFFLASPDADFISGQTLNVDGGKFMP